MNNKLQLDEIYLQMLEEATWDRIKAGASGLKAGAQQIGRNLGMGIGTDKPSAGLAQQTARFAKRINDFTASANKELQGLYNTIGEKNLTKYPDIKESVDTIKKAMTDLVEISNDPAKLKQGFEVFEDTNPTEAPAPEPAPEPVPPVPAPEPVPPVPAPEPVPPAPEPVPDTAPEVLSDEESLEDDWNTKDKPQVDALIANPSDPNTVKSLVQLMKKYPKHDDEIRKQAEAAGIDTTEEEILANEAELKQKKANEAKAKLANMTPEQRKLQREKEKKALDAEIKRNERAARKAKLESFSFEDAYASLMGEVKVL